MNREYASIANHVREVDAVQEEDKFYSDFHLNDTAIKAPEKVAAGTILQHVKNVKQKYVVSLNTPGVLPSFGVSTSGMSATRI
jgi:hypothetical protein